MKRTNLLLLFALISTFTLAQTVEIGKDACSHCNMIIRDQQFAAIAVGSTGDTQQFDAIECLVNFLKVNNEENFRELLIADYSRPGNWLSAQNAFYLKSTAIPSPMGAYLSAYSDLATAKKVQKQKDGQVYTWKELRVQFQNSNFGLLNHPDHHHDRPDAYAPIGIMGDHVHHKGGFMLSLRYMHMQMEGNLLGTKPISDSEIYQDYMAAPQAMHVQMYMLGVMYAPTDRLTLMLMQPLVMNKMEMQHDMDGMHMSPMTMAYQTKSSGLGDTKLSALYSLLANERASLHLNAGLSLPQGETTKFYDTPMSKDMKLPYSMQLGSGTFDMSLGATFKQSSQNTSWGLQPIALIRSGKNDEGYRFGNRYVLNGWLGHGLSQWLSISGRVEWALQEGIVGADDELNPMMAPPASKSNSGFESVRTFVGANFSFGQSDLFRNVKAGLEVGLPVYQKASGIQMKERPMYGIGLRYLI